MLDTYAAFLWACESASIHLTQSVPRYTRYGIREDFIDRYIVNELGGIPTNDVRSAIVAQSEEDIALWCAEDVIEHYVNIGYDSDGAVQRAFKAWDKGYRHLGHSSSAFANNAELSYYYKRNLT